MALTRRDFIRGVAFAALMRSTKASAAPVAASPALEMVPWTHGVSLLGNLKYPSKFAHFDYVNADAPKGGRPTNSQNDIEVSFLLRRGVAGII
jgi:microcin C transport system substrate-binding protein